MKALVKELWFVVECPHCHRPQVVNKPVVDGKVPDPMRPRYFVCEYCDNNCFIELEELETEIMYNSVGGQK
jgi:transcription elongation factor Elf1